METRKRKPFSIKLLYQRILFSKNDIMEYVAHGSGHGARILNNSMSVNTNMNYQVKHKTACH